jgi:class 3 adenylate cyclase
MLEALDVLNEQLLANGKAPVGMGVGINTGEKTVGNIGSKQRFARLLAQLPF